MGKINAEIPIQAMPEQLMASQTSKKTEERIIKEEKDIKKQRKEELQKAKEEEVRMPYQYRNSWEEKEEKQNQRGVKRSFKISAASYMMRLANASTTTAVGGILREARAQQSFVKRSGASKKEIMKALAILKRVIASGNRKIAGLKKEQQLENRRRAAKGSGNVRETVRLLKELKKHRRARRAGEIAAVADSEQVIIHDHNNNALCPNEFSMNGLIRDFSDSLSGTSINTEVGADTGVCCAASGEVTSVDMTI